MPTLQRRRLLRTLGATATGGGLAGCLDDLPGTTDGDDRIRGDAVVDYPGMVDGEASVSADERTIEYDEPPVTFELSPVYENEQDDGSRLRVSRDLSGETMTAFVAPVYVDADRRFEFHVFGNDALVEFDEWDFVNFANGAVVIYADTSFEHVQGPVHGFVVTPDSVNGVGTVDTVNTDEGNGREERTYVAISCASGTLCRDAPNVSFDFEYDAGVERLEVTHDIGESVPAGELSFLSSGDVTVRDGFEGTVGTGDAATLSAPPTAEVDLVWVPGETAVSATLAEWTGPDA